MRFDRSSLSIILVALVATVLVLFGCEAGLDGGTAESASESARSPTIRSAIKAAATTSAESFSTTVASTSSEYKFPATIDPEVQPDVITELWARVYHPTMLVPGMRYPVVLFLHGNHGTCGHGTNPRIDDSNQYTLTGTCPPGDVVTPNHAGYGYVADQLASQGTIVVSINANRGITLGDGVPTDPFFIVARANLVLKHLEMLSQWDRGVAPSPATLAVNLRDHLDLGQVGLMGQSRGGEGVRVAVESYQASGSPWPARIVTPVHVGGVFEIDPVDGQILPLSSVQNMRWAVMLSMCDGDLTDLQGIRPFDRVMSVLHETPPAFKSSLTVWGANHNYFNSEWQISDSGGCLDHAPIFNPESFGSASQREVGRIAMASFFLANVGAQRDPALNALFDPANGSSPGLTTITRVDRGFTSSPDQDISLRLEDFDNPTGTSTRGQANLASGISIAHSAIVEHDPAFRAGRISWENGGQDVFFQSNFAPAGSGISLLGYETLDMRVDRADDPDLNSPTFPTDFTVQLVNAQNALSAPQRIASHVSLVGPVGGPGGRHSMLQTARIPLGAFAPTTLNAIRGVRLTFDQSGSSTIYVANIRATRATCTATPKLDLKVRQVVRRSSELQFRFQVFNRDAAPVRLSDLSLKMWISDPTTNLVAQVYYGGHVYGGTGAYQFGSVAATSATSRIQPACASTPTRKADWAATVAGADTRALPANGGVWTDGEFSVHRADWTDLSSFADDFSQTPAYQGGVVSDATWPAVLGDDTHFVLYYRGTPVTEVVAPTIVDPHGGSEPSCITSCVSSVTNGLPPKYVAGTGPTVAGPSSRPTLAPLAPLAPVPVAQGKVASLSVTKRSLVPGGVDLEAVSDTAFPTGDAVAVLEAGALNVVLSNRPAPNDMHRLAFTFSAVQFAQLQGGEALAIRYGHGSYARRWDLGTLDLSMLTK